MYSFTSVIISRFILNLRDVIAVSSSVDLASSPSQIPTLAFARHSWLVGTIGYTLDLDDGETEDTQCEEDMVEIFQSPGRPPSLASMESVSSSFEEFSYIKEVG